MNTLLVLRLAAAIMCALMAGVYFAFSTAVMGGLARLEPAQGIRAMQFINRVILNPLFLIVFVGSAVLCAIVVFVALRSGASAVAVGGLLFIAGSLLITVAFNVPLNNAVDALNPDVPASADLWVNYLDNWTRWNHARGVTSLIAAALLAFA